MIFNEVDTKAIFRTGLKLEQGKINIKHDSTCWLCKTFNGLEDHHIIPRCSGGENGPQVRLCGVCHTAIHNMAFNKKMMTGEHDLMARDIAFGFNRNWTDTLNTLCALNLSKIIYFAALAFNKDPNKKVKANLTLTGKENKMLTQLVKVLPGINSKEKAIKYAIRALYQSKFTRDL